MELELLHSFHPGRNHSDRTCIVVTTTAPLAIHPASLSGYSQAEGDLLLLLEVASLKLLQHHFTLLSP